MVLLDRSDGDIHGDIDISGKVSALEYDDEILQNCAITLNAKRGRYLTKGPIIRKWQKIYVELKDRNGATVNDVFHVKVRKKILQNGLQLKLMCSHESSELWKRTISIPARRYSGFQALNSIVDILNDNKGTDDPFVKVPITFNAALKAGNRFDPSTANDYIFESVKLESAIDEIVRIEQSPVSGGGSFEPMFVRFKSEYNHETRTGRNSVLLQAFEQGYVS